MGDGVRMGFRLGELLFQELPFLERGGAEGPSSWSRMRLPVQGVVRRGLVEGVGLMAFLGFPIRKCWIA